jgi:ABC-type branched-subunit amino acid transport system ATPase component
VSQPILRVESLAKRFGGLEALAGVSLAVAPGEFRAIIGPNGAGKSTFFNTMTGLLRPDAGRVLFEGRDVTGEPPHRLVRRGVARTFQITSVFHDLTALENVQISLLAHARQAWSVWPPARALHIDGARDLLAMVGLSKVENRAAGTLSHGDQKRLELAIALAGEPRLLLLDEPTAGMSPQERRATGELLAPIKSTCSLLIVEHDLDFIKDICDSLTVLDQGGVVASGPTAQVQSSERVREAYFVHA